MTMKASEQIRKDKLIRMILDTIMLIALFVTLLALAAIYFNRGSASIKVNADPHQFLKAIARDDSWVRDDSMLEYSDCWVHWVMDEDLPLVKDAVFCVPD